MPDRRDQQVLGYEAPSPTRTSGTELAFRLIALICGVALVCLGLVYAIMIAPRHGKWPDRVMPPVIMFGAGSAALFIGVRALRRIRIKRGDQ